MVSLSSAGGIRCVSKAPLLCGHTSGGRAGALQTATGNHHRKVIASTLNHTRLERTVIPLARGKQSQQLNYRTSKLSLHCKSRAQQLPGIVLVSKTDQSHLIMSHFICTTSVRKLVKTRLTGYSASQADNQIKQAVAQLLAMIIFTLRYCF